jgi:anaerobic selenocysteine-containing dehydrogenase
MKTFEHVAQMVIEASAPIAVPGSPALAQSNGLSTAEAILAFNAMTDNFGKPGGVFIPRSPRPGCIPSPRQRPGNGDFISQMNSGAVSTLFVHGVNPVFELPQIDWL